MKPAVEGAMCQFPVWKRVRQSENFYIDQFAVPAHLVTPVLNPLAVEGAMCQVPVRKRVRRSENLCIDPLAVLAHLVLLVLPVLNPVRLLLVSEILRCDLFGPSVSIRTVKTLYLKALPITPWCVMRSHYDSRADVIENFVVKVERILRI